MQRRSTSNYLWLICLIVGSAAFSTGLAQAQRTSKPTTATKPAVEAPARGNPSPATPLPTGDRAVPPGGDPLTAIDARTQKIIALQVALDRAGFSPGEIDGRAGKNTERALRAFQEARGLPAGTLKGEIDAATAERLGVVYTSAVATYAISADDVAGPFVDKLPTDMMAKAQLPSLAYVSVEELLAERFHVSPKLLKQMNPDARFERGEVIAVPNVETFVAPGTRTVPQQTDAAGTRPSNDATRAGGSTQPQAAPPKTDATRTPGNASSTAPPAQANVGPVTITVTDATKTLTVKNAAGETIFHAPVTTGSANDPLPVGEWKVNGVSRNPTFNYNPDLFWDADPSHAKAKIAAGPNNPVGVVWIDLSKEHYGIHGTPEPSRIGYTESHGCIRLTNWDAMKLASMVGPGTKVTLQ
jgi:lipoprotein-anchoring transpeptidase ErfK/SrfK